MRKSELKDEPPSLPRLRFFDGETSNPDGSTTSFTHTGDIWGDSAFTPILYPTTRFDDSSSGAAGGGGALSLSTTTDNYFQIIADRKSFLDMLNLYTKLMTDSISLDEYIQESRKQNCVSAAIAASMEFNDDKDCIEEFSKSVDIMNLKYKNQTLLSYAVDNGKDQIVEKLLKCGSNPTIKRDDNTYHLFHAFKNRQVSIVRILTSNQSLIPRDFCQSFSSGKQLLELLKSYYESSCFGVLKPLFILPEFAFEVARYATLSNNLELFIEASDYIPDALWLISHPGKASKSTSDLLEHWFKTVPDQMLDSKVLEKPKIVESIIQYLFNCSDLTTLPRYIEAFESKLAISDKLDSLLSEPSLDEATSKDKRLLSLKQRCRNVFQKHFPVFGHKYNACFEILGSQVLFAAIKENAYPIIDFCLNIGVDAATPYLGPSSIANLGETIIHQAIRYSNPETLETILSQAPLASEILHELNPLQLCIELNKPAHLKALKNSGHEVETMFYSSVNSLSELITIGHSPVIKVMLSKIEKAKPLKAETLIDCLSVIKADNDDEESISLLVEFAHDAAATAEDPRREFSNSKAHSRIKKDNPLYDFIGRFTRSPSDLKSSSIVAPEWH